MAPPLLPSELTAVLGKQHIFCSLIIAQSCAVACVCVCLPVHFHAWLPVCCVCLCVLCACVHMQLGWVPETASREATYEYLNMVVPDEHK